MGPGSSRALPSTRLGVGLLVGLAAVLGSALGGPVRVVHADATAITVSFPSAGQCTGAALPVCDSYSPASVTVPAGGQVVWTDTSGIAHTAQSDGNFNAVQIPANGSSEALTLATPGTFSYHCTLHPSMTGTIVVTAPQQGSPVLVAPPGSLPGQTTPPSGEQPYVPGEGPASNRSGGEPPSSAGGRAGPGGSASGSMSGPRGLNPFSESRPPFPGAPGAPGGLGTLSVPPGAPGDQANATPSKRSHPSSNAVTASQRGTASDSGSPLGLIMVLFLVVLGAAGAGGWWCWREGYSLSSLPHPTLSIPRPTLTLPRLHLPHLSELMWWRR